MSVASETGAVPPPLVAFSGDQHELFRLVLRNTLLTILTLGIYRFWAVTNLRQFYWQNTSIDGDAFEYTGTAMELLIGAVIVFAIIFGFIAVANAIGTGVDLSAFLFVLYPLAIWRARRYRLARTRWRGIRFGQHGGQMSYTIKYYLWFSLMIVTLGITYPLLRRHRHGALLNSMSFGNEPSSFTGTGRELFASWMAAQGMILLASLVALFFVAATTSLSTHLTEAAALIAIGLSAWTAFIYYRVREFQFFASHLQIGNLTFWAWFELKPIIKLFLRYLAIVIILAFLLVFLPLAWLFSSGITLPDLVDMDGVSPYSTGQSLGIVATVVGALIFIMVQNILRHVVWIAPLLTYGAGRIAIGQFNDVERIGQSAADAMERGEGLAEILDVDAGF